MRRFTAVKTVTISSGTVELTDEQAKPRARKLIELGEGQYKVFMQIQLKAGEEFGYDGILCQSVAQPLNDFPAEDLTTDEQETETEVVLFADVEAITVDTLMAILDMKFSDVRTLLKEKYETSIGKKADEVSGDVLRHIAVDYDLGESFTVEKGEESEGGEDLTTDEQEGETDAV